MKPAKEERHEKLCRASHPLAQAGIRGLACSVNEIAQATARRRQATSASTAVLGCGLTGATLLGSLLKVRQRRVKIEGSRALRKLVASPTATPYPGLRCAGRHFPANTHQPSRGCGGSRPEGLLTVVKDLGVKDLYESVVPLGRAVSTPT